MKVKQIIEKAECIAIISDGWSNVRGQGIINYISTPQPVIYKSTDKGQQTHWSLNCRCAEGSQRPLTTACICTGDRQCWKMKAASSKVESNPHVTPIGCAAHALNLLFKDIMALKTMDTLYTRAKKMVRYVKGHQVIAAIYLTKQSEKNKSTTLKLPSNMSSCLTVSWRGRSLSKKWRYHSLPIWTAPSRGSSWMSGKQPETYSLPLSSKIHNPGGSS